MSRNQRSRWSAFRLQGFRFRLVAVIVVAGFLCICLNAVLFYAYVLDSYALILGNTTLPEDIISERYAELRGFAFALGGLSAAVLAVVVVWTVYITHRVSGPVYHLHKVMLAIHDGKIDERVYLRQKDEFHDVARSFNALMDKFVKSEASRADGPTAGAR